MRIRTPVRFGVQKTEQMDDWLLLARTPALGGRRLIDLLEAHGSVAALCTAARSNPARLGLEGESREWLAHPDPELIAADRRWLEGQDCHLLGWDSEFYPPLLRRTSSPPAWLFVHGDPTMLWQPQVAIIGSRNPTSGGLDNARAFSAEMSRRGFVVTSGLASGIDHAAHAAALDGGGRTVAVAGTGLDQVYPASSARTARRIPAQGALVSEFPPGTAARRSHFPSRNRIIAGLSLGVLVVEAGLNSGSLITAHQAMEQGREVFALPGSLHNPMAKGCHRLIKEGARLVETCDDIVQYLGPLAAELAGDLQAALAMPETEGEAPPPSPGLPDDPDYQRLWEALAYDPQPFDRLVGRTGLPVRSVSSMLLQLELRGLVESHPGAAWSRVS